ncbi:MAG TPA: hypothetical protein VGC70_04680 [Burkholderiales bacterium]
MRLSREAARDERCQPVSRSCSLSQTTIRLALTLIAAGILFGAYTLYAQGTFSATHERDKRAAERQSTEKVDKDRSMEPLLLEILLIPRNGT